MGRHRKNQDNPTQTIRVPDEGLMEVKLTGPAGKIREQMGISDGVEADHVDAPEAGSDDELLAALNDAKNYVSVKRISPREWVGVKCNVEVWRENCPLSWQDIHDEVSANHGGKKYRVAVMNASTGETVLARRIEIDGDPIVQKSDPGPDFFMNEAEPSPSERGHEALEQQSKSVAKQIELETLQQQLETLKVRRSGNGNGNSAAHDFEKIAKLEREIVEAKYEAKIAAMETARAVPAQPQSGSNDLIRLLMDQQRRSDERFERVMEQMQSNQLTALRQDIAQIKNAPRGESASMQDSIMGLIKMGKALGWNVRDEDDEDDEDAPWYEKLADKYLPKVFELVEERSSSGSPMTKEEIVAQMNAAADKAVAEDSTLQKAKLLEQQRLTQAKQQPQAQNTPPVASPTPQAKPAPVDGATAATAAAPVMSIEEEIRVRCANAMAVLEREASLRPREWDWTLIWWGALPEAVFEKAAVAADLPAMFQAFDGILNADGIKMMCDKVAQDPKFSQWVGRGHAELKEWYAKAQVDPSFDPAAEEEGE